MSTSHFTVFTTAVRDITTVSILTMDNLEAFSNFAVADKEVKKLTISIRKKTSEEQISELVTQRNRVATGQLTKEQYNQLLSTRSLSASQKESILISIDEISKLEAKNAKLLAVIKNTEMYTQKVRENAQAKIDDNNAEIKRLKDEASPALKESGKSLGSAIGMTAVTTLFSVISSYSSAKQAQSAGKAVGHSISTGVSSALSHQYDNQFCTKTYD